MSNLAIKLMPKSLDEIYGNDQITKLITNWIEKDSHPSIFFISGKSGSGKGCLAHNYIKTTLCLNRKPGESKACGKCHVCKKIDPRTTHESNNILWVQTGKESSTINAQFKQIEQFAYSPPCGDPTHYHRYHKFVVIDEAQSIPINLLERLLFSTELPLVLDQARTTFIIITMDEERFHQKNPSFAEALISRSGKGYVYLPPPTTNSLIKFCKEKLELEDPQIIDMLIDYSNKSYRALIGGYESLLDNPDYDLTYAQSRLQLVSPYARKLFWDKFSKAKFSEAKKELREYWDDLVSVYSEKRFVKQLLQDLDRAYLEDQSIPINLIRAISHYLNNPDNISAWYTLSVFMGTEIHPPFDTLSEQFLEDL